MIGTFLCATSDGADFAPRAKVQTKPAMVSISDFCPWMAQELQCYIQRLLPHRAHVEDRETEHVAVIVDLLHDLIVVSLLKVARLLFKDDLEVVALSVIPDLHMPPRFGHRMAPF